MCSVSSSPRAKHALQNTSFPAPAPISTRTQVSKDRRQSKTDVVAALELCQRLGVRRARHIAVAPIKSAGPAPDSHRFVMLGPVKRSNKVDYWTWAPHDNVRDGALRGYVDLRHLDFEKPLTDDDILGFDQVHGGNVLWVRVIVP
jgi:hypothetical protein